MHSIQQDLLQYMLHVLYGHYTFLTLHIYSSTQFVSVLSSPINNKLIGSY